MAAYFCLTSSQGRICLILHCHLMGKDCQIILSGGEAHIGAVAVAQPNDRQAILYIRSGHKEDQIAEQMAMDIAHELKGVVCVSVGIHYPSISQDEIATVKKLSEKLTRSCLDLLIRLRYKNLC